MGPCTLIVIPDVIRDELGCAAVRRAVFEHIFSDKLGSMKDRSSMQPSTDRDREREQRTAWRVGIPIGAARLNETVV